MVSEKPSIREMFDAAIANAPTPEETLDRVFAREDLTALSYWFPRLVAAGLQVPRTTCLQMSKEAVQAVWPALDNNDIGPEAVAFFGRLREACDDIGYPCFLRTDHTSGKHEWSRTCFVPDAAGVTAHAFAIIYFSECVSFFGELPWHSWAVRELLPTMPLAVAPRYGDMPVCREFRFFVDGGEVQCWHPYWPLDSLEMGGVGNAADVFAELSRADDMDVLKALASAAGAAVGGAWSVDLLETERGWFITDMAEAAKSFHWEGCSRQAMEE